MKHGVTTHVQYWAPFDMYKFVTSAFVIERDTNKSLPLAVLAVGGSGSLGLSTNSSQTQTENNFTYVAQGRQTTVQVESRTISAQTTRSEIVMVFTCYLFMANWAMTVFSWYTASLVVKNREEIKDGAAFFPLTVILTIPAIRALYGGSPPFGIFLGTHMHRPAPLPGIDMTF